MDKALQKRDRWIAVLLCAVLFCALVFMRVELAPKQDSQNFTNSDAVWHTLLTVRAMQEMPASEHKFLPIVSLGGENDKGIPWGTMLADEHGNYFYTSFSPVNFIVPYLFFALTGLPLNETSLYVFSSILSFFCYAALAVLLVRMLRNRLPVWFILAVSFLLYFFLPEMIHSNAMVFWAQSLWQLVFLLQLNAYYMLRQSGSKWRCAWFFLLSVFSCVTEWTGYIANVGFAGVAFLGLFGQAARKEGKPDRARRWRFIGGLALCCVAALGIYLLRFSMALPLRELLREMLARMGARSGNVHKVCTFIAQYWNSFNWLWIALTLSTALSLLLPVTRKRYFDIFRAHRALLFVTVFPLLENIVMMDHANQYTYDRMKAAIPLILLMFYALYALTPQKKGALTRIAAMVVVAVFSVAGVANYARYGKVGNNVYRWQMAGYPGDYALAQYINGHFDADESLLAMEGPVRGWALMCFGRGIYEYSVDDEMVALALEQGKRYVIIIVVEDNGNQWEKDVYPMIKVIDTTTGETKRIPVELIGSIDPKE